MALCQYAQGGLTEAEQTLARLNATYPASRFRDESSYQRAQIALDQGRYQDAVTQFTDVIRQNPNGTTAPFAYLKRGVAYSNLKEYDKASADYKKILNDYPGNAASNNAIEGLRESLTNEGKIEEFSDYLAQYKKANPESGSTEGLEFDAAKGLYFNQKYQKAVTSLESYVKSYPGSNLNGEAYFYMGEAYYRLNDRLKAIESHELVVKDGRSNYVTRSLQRLGEMENTGGNYEKSIAYYRKLNTQSRNRKEQINSMVGLMENYFEMGKLDSAGALADEVLKLPNVTLDAQNKATLFRGKISYANGDMDKATDDFLTTLNTAKDVNGAEAQYLTAEILFKKKEYNQSINTLYELNKDFSQFQRWKDKAFLLIADNFIAMGNTYQATATLNSIISESPDKKTKDAAKAKLDSIKGGESKETVE
jgi:TolA-binding protein